MADSYPSEHTVCPGANPLVCQATYDTATRTYNGNRDQTFYLSVPRECEDLWKRVMGMWGEGGEWLNAPYTPTRQGFIDRNEAIDRAYNAGLWLLEAKRVLAEEPGTCR